MLILLAFGLQTAFSQVFWTESFSNQAAAEADWTNGGTNGGTEVWAWQNDPSLATFGTPDFAAPTAADGFFLFDSDTNGEFDHDVTLTGPSIDCSASTNTTITFWAQYAHFTPTAVATLNVSTDGGTTWTEHILLAGFPADQMFNGSISIDIPEADGQAAVMLQFRWTGNYEYSWKVDDIQLESVSGPVPCDQNPMSIICDNLDTYNAAIKLGPQAPHWTTWSGTEGGAEDGIVSTEQANTAPNSLKIVSTAANGGPQDVVLNLGNKSTGKYELKFNIYVPAGKNGYYNIQQSVPIGNGGNGDWNLNHFFNNNGEGEITDGNNVSLATFTFPYNQWFECKHVFDLDNNIATYYVNGNFVKKAAYTRNLGGVDFFGTNNISTFYVDDVEYVELPAVVYNVDNCDAAVDLSLYMGQTPNVPQLTGLYDNTNATFDAGDPTPPDCWLDGFPNSSPVINGSMWYTFTGDGDTYHVETVPCNATDYIDDGDTQMALYTGECGNFTLLDCNDDLSTADDFRSALDIETTNGTEYYLLIDGWSDLSQGFIADGQFCIEITRIPSISCAEGAVGTYSIANSGFICNADATGASFTINNSTFILPNIGPVYGMGWAISTAPLTSGAWPPTEATYVGNFSVVPSVYAPNFLNNGTLLPQNAVWYFTPVVVAGAVDSFPADAAFMNQLDISNACYFVGTSQQLVLLPALAPLVGTATFTQETNPPGNNGSIDLTVSGGLTDLLMDPTAFNVSWTGPNGFTSMAADPTGLTGGTYVATISDLTGCVDDITVTVSVTTSVKDPESVKSLTISPNPTPNTALLGLELSKSADVRVEILNTLGQSVHSLNAGKVNGLSQTLDLTGFANGTYILRVTVDGETAVRRVVLQR